MIKNYTSPLIRKFYNFSALLLLCACFVLPLSGQVIHGVTSDGTTGVSNNGYRVGQSFTAPANGVVTSISFVSPTGGVSWNLYLGADPGDGNELPGAVYETHTSAAGIITITLTTPLSITSSSVYRFEVERTDLAGFQIDVADPGWAGSDYIGGHESFDGILFDGNHPQITPINGQNLGSTTLLNDLDFGVAYTFSAPVALVSFQAQRVGKTVNLTWTTATEQENEGFEIEHSANGQSWQSIGFVAGNGNTSQASSYSFVDSDPAQGLTHYRLKQMDFDGPFEYSDVQMVLFESTSTGSISVFPNPSNGQFTIQMNTPDQQNTHVQLFNIMGKLVWEQRIVNSTRESLQKEMNLPQGIYLMRAQIGEEITTTKIHVN